MADLINRKMVYELHVIFDNHVTIDINTNSSNQVIQFLNTIISNQNKIMATLQDLQNEVTAEDTVIDSAITLLQGLSAQIAALEPNQAAIDALASDISSKTQSLADSITANTPAAPTP